MRKIIPFVLIGMLFLGQGAAYAHLDEPHGTPAEEERHTMDTDMMSEETNWPGITTVAILVALFGGAGWFIARRRKTK